MQKLWHVKIQIYSGYMKRVGIIFVTHRSLASWKLFS